MERRYYFLADVHLGLPVGNPAQRERQLVDFLEQLGPETAGVYLLGDIFDFWYEYQHVIPRGYTRVLGALVHLTDRGIPVHFFCGNHDIWTFDYLQNELGLIVHPEEFYTTIEGKHFLLAHGDGWGPLTPGFKIIRKVFRNRLAQRAFSTLHPWIGFSLARKWSKHNRLVKPGTYKFKGMEEPAYRYAGLYPKPVDYCIIGHLHTPGLCMLPGGGEFMVLGDWFQRPFVACAVGGDAGVGGGTKERGVEVVEPSVVIHLH